MNFIKNIISRKLTGFVSKEYISKYIKGDFVIVEAGAHIGVDTCEMAEKWPNVKIYAFEPIPELFNQLKEKTSKYSNVKCFQKALGDATGKCKIYQSSGMSDASSSILPPKEHLEIHPDVKFEQVIEVDVITLTDWMKEEGVRKVDFLWLDLQGFEFDVLKESEKILEKVSVIYTEVSVLENYSNQGLYPELKKFLEGIGFKVKREEIAWKDGGNVLFIRK